MTDNQKLEWKMRDWKVTDNIAEVEFAGRHLPPLIFVCQIPACDFKSCFSYPITARMVI